MAKITGYPDFTRLTDQELVGQLKYVWDALIGISDEVGKIAIPDTSSLEAAVKKLQGSSAALQGSVASSQASVAADIAAVQAALAAIPQILSARWAASGVSGSLTVWGTEDFNEDATLYELVDSNTGIRVKRAGTFFMHAGGVIHGATVDTGYAVSLRKNGNNIGNSGTHSGNTGGFVSLVATTIDQGEVDDVYSLGSVTTSNVNIRFSIAKLR